MLHIYFKCEPYGANIIFYSDATGDQVNKHMGKKYNVDMDCTKQDAGATIKEAHLTEDGTLQYFSWIADPQDIVTLVHECIHLANRILRDRGITVTPTDDETLAYYHGYLFKVLWNEMLVYYEKKQNRRKKK